MNEPIQNQPHRDSLTHRPLIVETVLPIDPTMIGGDDEEDRGWVEFRDQCRRQMKRPMDQRIKYGFCRVYKPVLDDAPWRSFNSTAEYRAWCAANLPEYLGFKPGKP